MFGNTLLSRLQREFGISAYFYHKETHTCWHLGNKLMAYLKEKEMACRGTRRRRCFTKLFVYHLLGLVFCCAMRVAVRFVVLLRPSGGGSC